MKQYLLFFGFWFISACMSYPSWRLAFWLDDETSKNPWTLKKRTVLIFWSILGGPISIVLCWLLIAIGFLIGEYQILEKKIDWNKKVKW